uniref:Uncharacterized protein n=1 Tax=viral metagenome TaxID=1070528 RepID=A0A6H1ZGK2_9ZZZZ
MHGSFRGYRVRAISPRDAWSQAELELLKTHWPNVKMLCRLLPRRTVRAMQAKANRCGLTPEWTRHMWTAREHSDLRRMVAMGCTRRQIAMHLGLSVQQVAARMQYTGIKMPKRRPVPCGDERIDSIRQRAFDLNMSMTEFDRSLGYTRRFSNCFKGKQMSLSSIGRAVVALGGKLQIEWED